jgi:hypothetical protein
MSALPLIADTQRARSKSPLSARSGHPGTPIPCDEQITVLLSALTREVAARRVAAAAGLLDQHE